MRFLRQSTASQEILLGPFVATADGSAQTGLTIANTDIKLLKGGSTSEANKNSGGGTHIAGGRYSAVLDATDTNTVGILEVSVNPASGIPWNKSYYVLEEAVYDILFAASATGAVPVASIANGAITAAAIATGAIDADAIADNAIDAGAIASDAITAAKIATGAITSAKFAAGAIDAAAIANNAIDAATFASDVDAEFLSYLVDDATRIDASALNTLSSHDPGEAIMGATDLGTGSGLTSLATATELAKVPKSDSNVTWNATALASINAQADTALADYDGPTNAEMVARTLAAASYATAAAQATAQADLDTLTGTDGVTLATSQPNYAPATAASVAALNDLSSAEAQSAAAAALTSYDPPTRAELTSDTNSVLSAIGDVPTNAELATALDPLPTAAENAAAVLAATVEGSVTVVQSIRLANAALGGKASGLETTEASYRDLGDTKDRIVATVDSDGNRTAVTRDLT